jgi:glycosyltransferase involved in cell wall biosynthesis
VKIAFVVPGFSRDPDDWAIPALQTLACRLARRHELHVFSLRYPAAGRHCFCNLVHHAIGGGTRAGLHSLTVAAYTIRALVIEHRRAPFDLFHAFWIDEPAFVAVLAGALCRRPVLASLGGGELVHLPAIGYGTWGSRWRRTMIRLALRRAALITAGSPLARRLCIERGIAPAKVEVAPLGVDTDLFRRRTPPAPQRPVIVQAASLTPVKNQTLLLDVAARLRARRPRLRVLIAGSGPLAEALREEAAGLGLTSTLVLQGTIPYPTDTDIAT